VTGKRRGERAGADRVSKRTFRRREDWECDAEVRNVSHEQSDDR
jgi:hypothetical protein